MLMKHKQKCADDNKTTIKTSNETHLHWKNHFYKNPLYFRIYADFEADNEKDNSSVGNKTTNIYKQNPVLNGYEILSELDDVLKSGYHKSPLGYDNVDWFVNEVIKLENRLIFYFKNTNKDIIMTKEDEEDNKIITFVDFVKRKYYLIKLEIIVIYQDHTDVQLIANVILMLHRSKVFFPICFSQFYQLWLSYVP